MYDEANRLSLAELDERYVRRESHEYLELLSNMSNATKATARIERYLVGGFDENGRYQMGMSAWLKVIAVIGGVVAGIGIAVVTAIVTHALRIG